jgi:hypothetical protein
MGASRRRFRVSGGRERLSRESSSGIVKESETSTARILAAERDSEGGGSAPGSVRGRYDVCKVVDRG